MDRKRGAGNEGRTVSDDPVATEEQTLLRKMIDKNVPAVNHRKKD